MTATAVTCVLATASTAVGQTTAVCARLQAQLDQFVSAVPRADTASRFDAAIAEHRYTIGVLREELGELECTAGSVIVLGSKTSRVCKRMREDLSRENAQLQRALKQRKGDLSGDNSLAKQRILAALNANDCSASDGVIIRDTLGVEGDEELMIDPDKLYRTVCVRMCDGFYYPIAFGATPEQFERDASQCIRTCPGAAVELFFHSVPDQESEEMISIIDQTPYRSLPNAFAYRRSGSFGRANCSCDEKPPSTGTIDAAPGSSRSVVIIDPNGKNAMSVLVDGKSAGGDAAAEDSGPPAREVDPEQRIRVVGPKFLPDQSEALDLQVPVPGASP